MSAAAFQFHGAALLADASGALYWPESETLAVADLHLEKGSAFAANGTPLPPYDSRETLRRLAVVLRRYRPRRVICLGDSFHDSDGAGRLARDEIDTLRRLTAAHEWIWITGNHDPEPRRPASAASPTPEFRSANIVFRHEAARKRGRRDLRPLPSRRHPSRCATAASAGAASSPTAVRLILPAFGAYAGGLDVRDPAIERLLGREYAVFILGRRGARLAHVSLPAAKDANRELLLVPRIMRTTSRRLL